MFGKKKTKANQERSSTWALVNETDCSIYNTSGLTQSRPLKESEPRRRESTPPPVHFTSQSHTFTSKYSAAPISCFSQLKISLFVSSKTMPVSFTSLFLQPYFQQCPSLSLSSLSSSCPLSSFHISVASAPTTETNKPAAAVTCCVSSSQQFQSHVSLVNGNIDNRISERNEIRLGLPSKGRMAADTLDLLKVSLFLK